MKYMLHGELWAESCIGRAFVNFPEILLNINVILQLEKVERK